MMWKLDRWIALCILMLCILYAYTAFFILDENLPPFMRFSPMWPSTFPKVVSVVGIICGFLIVLGIERDPMDPEHMDINYRKLWDYKWVQAVALLGLMVLYALCLRPFGFLLSTIVFLSLSSIILGERKYYIVGLISAFSTGGIWYLVHFVLGIYLSPLPYFMGIGG